MLDSKHVKDGFVIDDSEPEKFISVDTDNLLSKRCKPWPGDILISSRGSIGKIAIVKEGQNFNIMGNMILIRLPAAIRREFAAYYLHSQVEHIESIARGVAQKGLYLNQVREYELPFPPLPEQHRIVAILDEAFDGIATAKANAEKNLKNARALFESHLQVVFSQRGEGWVEKSLEELGTITSSKRIFKSEYVKSGVPFYRTKEIKELANAKEISTELYISEDRYNEIKLSFGVPKLGDILLTAIGTIGEIWVVNDDKPFYFKDGNVLWLKGFNSVHADFLKYVLISFVESLNKMAHGAAYSALPIQRLNGHRIFVPSLEEQELIVFQLDGLREETHRLESIYQQKIAALDELKKSLLHQAFSGQL